MIEGHASNLSRVIKSRTRGSAVQLRECLASLFALELASPGHELFVISPWVTDFVALPNQSGQFRGLVPALANVEAPFSAVLNALAERGTTVRVLCAAEEPRTTDFLRKLSGGVARRRRPHLHEKVMVGDTFLFAGSMNFTYSGLYMNDESVELVTIDDAVARALGEARLLWEAAE